MYIAIDIGLECARTQLEFDIVNNCGGVSSQRHGVVEVQIGMVKERRRGGRVMRVRRGLSYEVQVQVQGRDVGRIVVVKVVKAKVVTCRVG